MFCPGADEAAPGARSFLEGMLLPDATAFATEFLSQSWGHGHAGNSTRSETEQVKLSSDLEAFCALRAWPSHLMMPCR